MDALRIRVVKWIGLLCGSVFIWGCGKGPGEETPLSHSVYVWQQHWTPAVSEAVRRLGEVRTPPFELVVLGAQLRMRDGQPVAHYPDVDWSALRESGRRVGIGIRMEPFPTGKGEGMGRLFGEAARKLSRDAQTEGVRCMEIQLDYDCPQKRLEEYRALLAGWVTAVRPLRFCITALPAWLGEREFRKLVRTVDGFILQVHSVETRGSGEAPALFEGGRALRWVLQAAAAEHPFRVALPTYSGVVGFAPDGRRLGMALDGQEPFWPLDTRLVEFSADAADLARWVASFQKRHPALVEGLAWYRLPVGEGERNWRWPTFAAVLEGRAPQSQIKGQAEGAGLVDVSVLNPGEAEEQVGGSVVLRWSRGTLEDGEALPGWKFFADSSQARWKWVGGRPPRLLPGGRQAVGWVRLHEPGALTVEVLP